MWEVPYEREREKYDGDKKKKRNNKFNEKSKIKQYITVIDNCLVIYLLKKKFHRVVTLIYIFQHFLSTNKSDFFF